MTNVVHLTSKTNSLVIKLGDAPEILHWGKRVKKIDEDFILASERAISQARLDVDVPLSLCPELGRGLFSAPGLEGHRDSRDWAPVFKLDSQQIGEHSAIFYLVDEVAQLKLEIELELDYDSGVLKKRLSVTNTGSSNYQLTKLATTLPVPNHASELQTFYGRWTQEFQTQRRAFSHDGFIQENRRGRTSHESFPGLMAGTKGFTDQIGDVWGFHFAWSGNHQLRADVKSDGRRFVQASELLLPGEVTLAPGESYSTPSLYSCYSNTGLNGVSEAFHSYVRTRILRFPQLQKRPVHLNTWEGIYFDHDPEYIQNMATEAAKIGVERFIIDDGWFVGRDGERTALGDWYLDEVKYPNGLEPVIQHVNDLGMEFGLWVEPEMVSKESMLYRNHPDWLLELPGYEQPSGRWQYVLNLQNPDCFQYLFDRLDDLLTKYNIGYLKWDMNRELVQPGHNGRAAVHGQTKSLYKLVDRLRAKHPLVEIESCASGGGRIDFEILKRTHRFWASDCNDALERQKIQKGMSYFFPPEVMGSHIGPEECHSTNRRHHINMRGLTALSGHMGVELDPVKETEEQKEAFARYIALHKKYRPILHSGRSFRLDSADDRRNVYGVQSNGEMLITVCQLEMPDHALPEPLRFGCLDNDRRYRVEIVEMPKTSFQLMKDRPKWIDRPLEMSGEVLNEIGVALPLLDPESAMLIHVQAI